MVFGPSCPPMRPYELQRWTRAILSSIGVRPRRRLGQNFLVNPRIIKDFLRYCPPGEPLLEVGTGLGTLTCALARRASIVVSVEVDPVLVEASRRILGGHNNVLVILGDGIEVAGAFRTGVLVGSLPYSVASQVIVAATKNNAIRRMVVMIQEDVAAKIVAKPGENHYGRISAFIGNYFEPKIVGVYPPASFYPRPEVRSALVVLERRKPWMEGDEAFENLIRCLFSHKNKLLVKAMKMCGLTEHKPGSLDSKLSSRRVREIPPSELYALSRTLAGG